MKTKSNSSMEVSDKSKVSLLYQKLLESWNKNSADDFANLFSIYGNSIGFDGSQMNGRQEIYRQIEQIFASHKVASYIGIVREIRPLSSTVFLLRAVAGMFTFEKREIKPEVNTIQTLLAQKQDENFRIAIFHNTPAAFHERPDLREQLTKELQEALDNQLPGIDKNVSQT